VATTDGGGSVTDQWEQQPAYVQDVISRDTDRANGQEFCARYGDDYVWTPEAGWYVWDGMRWCPDDSLSRKLRCGDMADVLRMRAEEEDEIAAEVTNRRVRRLEQVAGLNGCLTFAEPILQQSILSFDKNTDLFNCPNGTVELRSGELRDHRKEDRITRLCPTPYDPDARDVVWDQVLRDTFDGDEDMMRYLMRFTGYSLSAEVSEKSILVVNGPTNSGKSTVTEAIYRTVGDVAEGGYATVWPAEIIQAGSNVNRDYLMDKSRGARIIFVAELERGSRMADSFVKQVSGGDVMNHRKIYLAPYDHRPTGKLFLHSNYVPRSTDPAVHARLKLLPFEHPARRTAEAIKGVLDELYAVKKETVGPDPRVKHHLETSPAAARAILAHAVRGATAWYREGMSATPWMAAALDRYVLESDHVWQFVQDNLQDFDYERPKPGATQDPRLEASIHVDRMWTLYSVWAVENVQRPFKRRLFEQALEERGLKKARVPAKGGTMRWLGMRESDEILAAMQQHHM
jgi:putative DNA primase/helicase